MHARCLIYCQGCLFSKHPDPTSGKNTLHKMKRQFNTDILLNMVIITPPVSVEICLTWLALSFNQAKFFICILFMQRVMEIKAWYVLEQLGNLIYWFLFTAPAFLKQSYQKVSQEKIKCVGVACCTLLFSLSAKCSSVF